MLFFEPIVLLFALYDGLNYGILFVCLCLIRRVADSFEQIVGFTLSMRIKAMMLTASA